ncbi:hypothetical protein OHS18_13410 [Amycolatopsis sp. NBC_00355]|uniref:hypothetical protein n=1 Tax=Amycolatopsis sp. NBC_00355 TaxID=2975957 RepID=UPI002E25E21F
MPDRPAYNASTIDWSRIRAYAQRVAREARTPAEKGISYTTTEYQTVTKQVEVKHGAFNLFTRVENKSERVAVSKCVDVVGSHWVLERRHHHIECNTKERTYTNQETTHEQHYVVLLADGSLKKVILMETENMNTAHGRSTFFATHQHHLRDLSASDVEAMDFEKRHSEYGTHGRGTKNWGDREPGKQLLSHAKGVGLTKALKRLLPG